MVYKLLLDGEDIYNPQDDRVLLDTNIDLELNAAGDCEFTMPTGHRYYDSIELLTQTLEIYDEHNIVIWYGRPTEISTDFYNQKKVYFEGPLAFFNDTIQRPEEYPTLNTSTHSFFRALIANHNSQVTDPNRQFTVGTLTIPEVAIYRKTDYETTKECLERMCVGAEGGYIMFRRVAGVNYIDWVAEPTTISSQPIVYAMNLTDFNKNIDCDDVFTCLIPLGDEVNDVKITIASVNDGLDYLLNSEAEALYGRIYKVQEFEGFSENTTEVKTKLKQEAQRFMDNKWNDFLKDRMSFEISAADLGYINADYSTLQLGKKVRVLSTPHGIDQVLPITKVSFSLENGVKDVSVGTPPRQTLTEIYYGD